ncbi:stalk domain-containing protein [Paenibacillus xylanexedens]|uniref:stalk domain-containing protein n=1 Tax=Paenibacillus xylanexedens TaxID=528191 RepID=UPI0011AA3D96|nr:stalk domain-containing protein [Paenibacillus xylanexedens]
MKKVAYIAGGILIGFVLSTSAGAFADSVKSLVGKKVSGEYTVIVNGQKLADKGAVIDGKANVPVRGISDALGADIKVEGKTITVTTADSEALAATDNKYSGRSADSLRETISILKDKILAPNLKEREEVSAELDKLREANADAALIKERETQLAGYDERIAATKADIAQAEAALAALK